MESRYAWCRSPAVWGVVGYHRLIVTKHLKVLVGMQMSGPQYGVPMAQSKLGWWLLHANGPETEKETHRPIVLALPDIFQHLDDPSRVGC